MKPEAPPLTQALAAGYERMSAWADLLDQINVFPVADEDTGRNLRISLAPLRQNTGNRRGIADRLLAAATGNSGNIAAGFFSGFLAAGPEAGFAEAARCGRDRAWKAVADPRPGTMLSVFDALAETETTAPEALIANMKHAVGATAETLPAMRRACVVDAGALGIYLFFEAFLAQTVGASIRLRPVTETFSGRLTVADGFFSDPTPRYCVDTVIRTDGAPSDPIGAFSDLGKSLVVLPGTGEVKIHLHTDRRRQVRKRLESMGSVIFWSEEEIAGGLQKAGQRPSSASVHVMTDAAGSISRTEAKRLGMTLLDSYLVFDDRTAPETLVAPETLYQSMRKGRRVTTAQASIFERHQCYQSALSRHDRVLYLCVGSVYTGNFQAASQWKRANDAEDRFTVVDSGAASGRLAVAAMAAARVAAEANEPRAVVEFARRAAEQSREYLFLDRLKYLAAGGRLSKTKGFFGDLLGKKPVITPTAEGAVKAGIVSDAKDQFAFALDRLEDELGRDAPGMILLQHSDNERWVSEEVKPALASIFDRAKIQLAPLSLTSGAHMGPGTWGVAFLREAAVLGPNRPGGAS